jgi:hypothetical protein
LKRVRSKIANREFYIADAPSKLNQMNGLPVLSKEDVAEIQKNSDKLGAMGICDVLDRKMRGYDVPQAIFDWMQFKGNKSVIKARTEFFDWVKKNFPQKNLDDPLGQAVQSSSNQGGNDEQDRSCNTGSLFESLEVRSATGSVSQGSSDDFV